MRRCPLRQMPCTEPVTPAAELRGLPGLGTEGGPAKDPGKEPPGKRWGKGCWCSAESAPTGRVRGSRRGGRGCSGERERGGSPACLGFSLWGLWGTGVGPAPGLAAPTRTAWVQLALGPHESVPATPSQEGPRLHAGPSCSVAVGSTGTPRSRLGPTPCVPARQGVWPPPPHRPSAVFWFAA